MLLSDGDVLRISPRVSFRYSGAGPIPSEPCDELQEREKKVDSLGHDDERVADSRSCSSINIPSPDARLALVGLGKFTSPWMEGQVDSLRVRL